MNIEKAKEIFGWMYEPELEWLAFEASRHDSIVEIGCYMGRSTRALADNARGVVYAVDHWNGPKEINPQPFPVETVYPSFCNNLADHISGKRVIPIRTESVNAATMFRQQFDMIFIDGSHDTQAVMDDIRAWAPLLKKGGLLCGHDSHWPGVEEARRLLLPSHMVFHGEGSIWALDNFQGLIG